MKIKFLTLNAVINENVEAGVYSMTTYVFVKFTQPHDIYGQE